MFFFLCNEYLFYIWVNFLDCTNFILCDFSSTTLVWGVKSYTTHPEHDTVSADTWVVTLQSSEPKKKTLSKLRVIIWVTVYYMCCVCQPLIVYKRESAGGNVLTSNSRRHAAWGQHLSQGQKSLESLAWLSLMVEMQIWFKSSTFFIYFFSCNVDWIILCRGHVVVEGLYT